MPLLHLPMPQEADTCFTLFVVAAGGHEARCPIGRWRRLRLTNATAWLAEEERGGQRQTLVQNAHVLDTHAHLGTTLQP